MNANNINDEKCFYSGSVTDLYKIELDKLIIVKMLKKEHTRNPIILRRFQQEKSILKKLLLSGIPKPLSVDIRTNYPYFAYEYIDGIRLDHLMQNNNINPRCAVDIVKQLFTHLSSFKDIGLIHSDISPDNIILDNNGKVHLIDFGSSYLSHGENATTSTWISKFSYCSPEQAQGKRWSHQSDLYQTGSLLYEMLCGNRLNTGKGREALAIAAKPPEPDFGKVPKKFHLILETLLDTQIENRCSSPHEALDLLSAIE